MNERVQRLRAAGVSIWLDTLSRELLETGEFERMMHDLGVSGATSNPTIFAKAITGSDRYDRDLRDLVGNGVTDPQELFFRIGLDDIRTAADLLRRRTSRARAATGSSPSSALRTSQTTRRRRSNRRLTCGRGSGVRTR